MYFATILEGVVAYDNLNFTDSIQNSASAQMNTTQRNIASLTAIPLSAYSLRCSKRTSQTIRFQDVDCSTQSHIATQSAVIVGAADMSQGVLGARIMLFA